MPLSQAHLATVVIAQILLKAEGHGISPTAGQMWHAADRACDLMRITDMLAKCDVDIELLNHYGLSTTTASEPNATQREIVTMFNVI